MRSTTTSSLLLAFGLATAQDTAPQGGASAAPFPNVVYPGYGVAYAQAGAKTNQTSPSSYPSPWMDGSGGWTDAYNRAQALVRQMTLVEKVNITTGVGWELERCVGQTGGAPRLGFRSMCMQDSPVGIRDTDFNSVFPAGTTIAATWDRTLMYQRGYGMGSEHRMKGSDVQLGPVVGPLGRAPEGGRNWEGFSPDPYLSGIAVGESVQGIQDAGVVACTKHYIGYEQEHFRQVSESATYGFNITETYSANIDDKTMHETYLWPFADAVRAGTGSIMCSYNLINNSYASQNSYTLNHLLKNELGFQGFVMTDWGAHDSGVGSALAGMDMSMPGDIAFDSKTSYWGANLTIAVLNGTVPEWRIDDMATRIIAAWYFVGRDKHQVPINFDSWTTNTMGPEHFIAGTDQIVLNQHVNVQQDHAAQIRTQAAMGTVLLKNTNGALPLDAMTEKFTAVFGDDAGDNNLGPNGCADRGCDNGTLGMAWGSGSANFPFLITPETAIQNEVVTNGNGVMQSITDNYAYDEIYALAGQSSVSMVFVNSDSGEGYITVDGNEGDRNNLTLWRGGDQLIKNVSSICNNTILVVHSTGPVLLADYATNPNITAILWAGIPGEQSGNSIADVLYGRVNPAGRLPFTMGATRQSYGTDLLYKLNNGDGPPQVNFEEGSFIDYRAFDKHGTKPTYEFGFGLSYTTFAYSDLSISVHPVTAYVPTTGTTAAAPSLGSPGSASDATYPSNITRVQYYIYPYLNSTNLNQSSGSTSYASSDSSTYIPASARDSSPQPLLAAGGGPGGNPQLYETVYTVTCRITNTGNLIGDEVPQLYLSHGGPDDPPKVLRGFDRLKNISPGQTVMFGADLTLRDISNWDTGRQDWVVTSHPKTVYVGGSSRMLNLQGKLPSMVVMNSAGASRGGNATMSSGAGAQGVYGNGTQGGQVTVTSYVAAASPSE
ncbi:MAG: hypothetical protein M1828_005860 [Chrysothrix sp. TS-e1954]|nr:MAG: hypothetical protein M1828_005860 [Chrysothrix sp. TS-e1954]